MTVIAHQGEMVFDAVGAGCRVGMRPSMWGAEIVLIDKQDTVLGCYNSVEAARVVFDSLMFSVAGRKKFFDMPTAEEADEDLEYLRKHKRRFKYREEKRG